MSKNLTKAELQDRYDQLKSSLLDLKDQIKELKSKEEAKVGDLTETAFSIYLTDDLKYQLVEVRFNPNSKEAQVVSITDIKPNNTDYAIAHMVLRERNTNVVMNNCSEKWSKLR